MRMCCFAYAAVEERGASRCVTIALSSGAIDKRRSLAKALLHAMYMRLESGLRVIFILTKRIALNLLVVALAALAAPASAQTRNEAPPEIYLIKGMYHVFSSGLDTLAARLKAQGLPVRVLNHTSWSELASELAGRIQSGQGPARIVLIGHSLGGNNALRLAAALGQQGKAVDLVIPLDSTLPQAVPANVRRLTHIYLPRSGSGRVARAGVGFRGRLTNIDLDQVLGAAAPGHTGIDKNGWVHRQVMAEITALPQASGPVKSVASSAQASEAKARAQP
jgi:acetyl esterase/lipase